MQPQCVAAVHVKITKYFQCRPFHLNITPGANPPFIGAPPLAVIAFIDADAFDVPFAEATSGAFAGIMPLPGIAFMPLPGIGGARGGPPLAGGLGKVAFVLLGCCSWTWSALLETALLSIAWACAKRSLSSRAPGPDLPGGCGSEAFECGTAPLLVANCGAGSEAFVCGTAPLPGGCGSGGLDNMDALPIGKAPFPGGLKPPFSAMPPLAIRGGIWTFAGPPVEEKAPLVGKPGRGGACDVAPEGAVDDQLASLLSQEAPASEDQLFPAPLLSQSLPFPEELFQPSLDPVSVEPFDDQPPPEEFQSLPCWSQLFPLPDDAFQEFPVFVEDQESSFLSQLSCLLGLPGPSLFHGGGEELGADASSLLVLTELKGSSSSAAAEGIGGAGGGAPPLLLTPGRSKPGIGGAGGGPPVAGAPLPNVPADCGGAPFEELLALATPKLASSEGVAPFPGAPLKPKETPCFGGGPPCAPAFTDTPGIGPSAGLGGPLGELAFMEAPIGMRPSANCGPD